MAKRKKKALDVPVPQSMTDAAKQLAKIGDLRRAIDHLELDADEKIARIGEKVAEALEPKKDDLTALEEGLQTFCEANRDALTNSGKTKTGKFPTGTVLWRKSPKKVNPRGIPEIIERLKKAGLKRFVRIKEELNKEAMLEEPDVATAIEGISIGGGTEDFIIEPAELEGAK